MTEDDDGPAPVYRPEVRAFLLSTARMAREGADAMRSLLDQGAIPEGAYVEAWHALDAAADALREAQPPGWQAPTWTGNLPPLPPPRRDRGLIR